MSEWTVDTLKEYFDAVLAERQKAVALQHIEYERRLGELNHAHEKAVAVQHTYVTQDKYEDYIKANAVARDVALQRVDERLDEWTRRVEAHDDVVDGRFTSIYSKLDEQRGAIKARANLVAFVFGVAGFLSAVASILYGFLH